MPLFLVTFTEACGYRVQCRIRAATGADHLTLAVKKIWGDACSWGEVSPGEGRVWEVRDHPLGERHHARTGWITADVSPAHRRARVP